jgi:hypothetical protein
MVTFNILTVTSFTELLVKMLEWRAKYNIETADPNMQWQRIRFDTPHLKEPLQYDMNILPKSQFMSYMEDHLRFIENNLNENDNTKFSKLEYEKFRRVVRYMETTNYSDEQIQEGRRDFFNWFTEFDRRRNTNFLETFPEMIGFYELCSKVT